MINKLIELIDDKLSLFETIGEAYRDSYKIAEHLISHGVTFADVPDTNVWKWIPVSERLPDDSGNVVLCTISRVVGVGFYDKNTRNWVQHYSGGGICVEVTHWMPLPEPPKEGE